MTSRPVISVFDHATEQAQPLKTIPLPAVFKAPIRLDIVQFVHSNIAKNRRQPHGVDPRQGHKHSAESWGPGRAVARIPRVSGSGTHRSGQGAFGNQCRKGRMFAPLKIWRRWNRRVNITQKRHAVASALAASALVPLVIARGHKIEKIPELPLVFDDKLESIEKTKKAVQFLRRVGAYADVKKVIDHKNLHQGKGKMRNKRFNLRKGPLFVYSNDNVNLIKAVRNIPGVDVCNVNRLNLLSLAPGGQLGRFIIWTETAFASLNKIFGTYRYGSLLKQDYQLLRPQLTNADLARIINSNEIQEAINPAKRNLPASSSVQKKNPLTNDKLLFKLDPHAAIARKQAQAAQENSRKLRKEILEKKRAALSKDQKDLKKKLQKRSATWYKDLQTRITESTKKALEEEETWKIKEIEIIEEEDVGAGKEADEEEEEEEAPAKDAKDTKDAKGKEKDAAGKEGAKDAKKDDKKDDKKDAAKKETKKEGKGDKKK